MAAANFSLVAPTGANQYSNQSYALPGLGAPGGSAGASTLGPGTGYEMFSSPGTSGSTSGGDTYGGATGIAPQTNTPGIVSQPGLPVNMTPAGSGGLGAGAGLSPTNPIGPGGGVKNVGSGASTVDTLFPDYTSQYANMLQSQLGQGATPFDQSTLLPSSNTATTPGQLNAPLDQLNQMLQQFYATGTGGPAGSSTLQSMSQTGNPTDVGPAWNAMLKSEDQNTANNAANLREQFASAGNLSSSPFANAITQFYNQNTLNQNAQLTQAEQSAQEAAAGRQLTAGQDLTQGATGLGSSLQSLDQSAIQNMLAEFIRTSPDYSPLLSAQGGLATTFPPTIEGNVGVGAGGGALSSAGTALSGIADLWSALDPHGNAGSATTNLNSGTES